jgi:hypothetical protein
MERTHALLQDQSIPDAELEAYIEGIGEMLCGIDLVESASIEMPEQSKVKSWVPAVLKAGVVAVATWKARDMWEAR